MVETRVEKNPAPQIRGVTIPFQSTVDGELRHLKCLWL